MQQQRAFNQGGKRSAGRPRQGARQYGLPPPPPRERQKGGRQGNPQPAPGRAPGVSPHAGQPQEARIPPADAFRDVKRLPPPEHLPGWEEEKHSAGPERPPPPTKKGGKRKQGTGSLPPARQQRKAGAKSKKGKPQKPKKPVNPAKRRRNRLIVAVLSIVVLIAAGVWFSVNMLFKIEQYDVEGESPYTVDEIKAVFGHDIGENMLGWSAASEEKRIERTLPYIESIEVRRRLPDTVVFRVTPAVEAYSLAWGEQYAVLSTTRKVLRMNEEQPEELTLITGLQDVSVVPGLPLSAVEGTEGKGESASAPAAATSGASTRLPAAAASGSEAGSQPEESSSLPSSSLAASSAAEGEDGEQQDPAAGNSGGSPPASSPEEGAGNGDGEGSSSVSGSAPPAVASSSPKAGTGAALFGGSEDATITRTTTLEALTVMLEALEASGLEDVTWVDVSNVVDLRFRWEDRITVKLGSRNNIEEKMKYVRVVCIDPDKKKITPGDRGSLDVSGYPDNLDYIYFTPEA